jgi:di/tricarboxylate transporter
MADNTTYGIQRIKEANISGVNETYNGTSLTTWESRFGELFSENLAGSYEMTGLLVLIVFGYGLHQSDASTQVSATVMIPAVILLASGGFLPGGEGILFGLIIVIAGIGFSGAYKFIGR